MENEIKLEIVRLAYEIEEASNRRTVAFLRLEEHRTKKQTEEALRKFKEEELAADVTFVDDECGIEMIPGDVDIDKVLETAAKIRDFFTTC
jgi:hypothetical protein